MKDTISASLPATGSRAPRWKKAAKKSPAGGNVISVATQLRNDEKSCRRVGNVEPSQPAVPFDQQQMRQFLNPSRSRKFAPAPATQDETSPVEDEMGYFSLNSWGGNSSRQTIPIL